MVAGRRNAVAILVVLSITPIVGCSSNSVNNSSGNLKSCAEEEICVPSPPDFWTGPVAIAAGGLGDPPSCTGEYATQEAEGFDGLVGEPATCEGCSCGSANVSCGPATVTIKSASCLGACENQYLVEPNTCQDIDSCAVPGEAGFAQIVAGTGSGTCTPIGPTKTDVPEAKWTEQLVACSGTTGASCGSGSVCAPAPPSGFSDTLCVFRGGDHSCPAPYTKHRVIHEGFSDDRSCTCSCEPATGISCNGMLQYWDLSPGCGGTPEGAFATGLANCNTVSSLQALSLSYDVTPAGGQCEPSPDPATGAATPESPITICCLP